MDIKTIIYIYIDCPMACLSFILVLFSVIVLSRLENTARIFVYLKFESILILIDCFFTALLPSFICTECVPNLNPLAACLLHYIGFNHMADTSKQASIILATFAALTCFYMLDAGSKSEPKWWQYLKSVHPMTITLVGYLLCSLNYGYEFFAFRIYKNSTWINSNDSVSVSGEIAWLDCDYVDFRESWILRIWAVFALGFGYAVMMLTILAVNIAIALKVKRELSMSKKLNQTGLQHDAVVKRKASEHKMIKLILVDCFNLVAGRVPSIVIFLLYHTGVSESIWSCLSLLCILISYSFKFFILLKFNRRFRAEVFQMLCFKHNDMN